MRSSQIERALCRFAARSLASSGIAAGGTPKRVGELVRTELARWSRVVNGAGIKAH